MNAPALIDTATAVPLRRDGGVNRRELAKARTRARVIEAARFLFVNVGYEAATMRDVARRAGVSTGAVFANVTDKADLYAVAMAAPPPTLDLADEIGRILALRPGWRWLIRWTGSEHMAHINAPDWMPNTATADQCFVGRGTSPASALREARIAADRHLGAGMPS